MADATTREDLWKALHALLGPRLVDVSVAANYTVFDNYVRMVSSSLDDPQELLEFLEFEELLNPM